MNGIKQFGRLTISVAEPLGPVPESQRSRGLDSRDIVGAFLLTPTFPITQIGANFLRHSSARQAWLVNRPEKRRRKDEA
jgi:hypothetical protein